MNGKARYRRYYKLPNSTDVQIESSPDCFAHDGWVIQSDSHIEKGSYGSVYRACRNSNCDFVGKLIELDFRYAPKYVWNIFKGEALISEKAGDLGVGVPIYSYFLCNEGKTGVLIMERMDKDIDHTGLPPEDLETVLTLIKKMHDAGILHRDLFARNVMYKDTDQGRIYRIIDFGLAIAFGKGIPAVLRGIDYVNLLKSIPNITEEMMERGKNYIIEEIGENSYNTATKWIEEHQETCASEFFLLKHLPEYLYEIYGPGVMDLLVWSVRCSPEKDKEVTTKISDKVRNMKKKINQSPRPTSSPPPNFK